MPVPDQIQKGHTFVDGDVVDAASLNALADQAIALKGIIQEQPVAAPDPAADTVMFYDVSATDLRRCLIQALPSGIETFDMNMPVSLFTVVVTGSTDIVANVSFKTKAAGLFFCGPISGAAAAPDFRAIVPADLTQLITIAAFDIDCSLGSSFTKSVTANGTYHIKNSTAGQVIKVRLIQTGAANFVAHFDSPDGTVRWPGGVEPVLTTGAGRTDVYEFLCCPPNTFEGHSRQNFTP